MKYITIEQVLAIHDLAIKRFGGSHGVLDTGLIESAIASPQVTFGGKELYPDIFLKTAALLHSLLKNHAFVDGNKRTSISVAGIFLRLNGYTLIGVKKGTIEFALNVKNESLSLEAIALWLKKHSKKR